MMCEHDINSPNKTVSIFRRRFMALPGKIYGKCDCCSKIFTYILNENGLFVKEEGEKDESKSGDVRTNE